MLISVDCRATLAMTAEWSSRFTWNAYIERKIRHIPKTLHVHGILILGALGDDIDGLM